MELSRQHGAIRVDRRLKLDWKRLAAFSAAILYSLLGATAASSRAWKHPRCPATQKWLTPIFFFQAQNSKRRMFPTYIVHAKCKSGPIWFNIPIYVQVQLPSGFSWIYKIVARASFVLVPRCFAPYFFGDYSQDYIPGSPSSAIIQQIPSSSSPSLQHSRAE